MGKFSQYEVEISTHLQPLRDRLAAGNIPIATLPKEAGKFTQKYPGSLRVLVGHSYRGKKVTTSGQEREIDLSVYIRLAKRYEDEPQPPLDPALRAAAVDWVEEEVIRLLLGVLLPTAATEIFLKNGRLSAPEEGEWEKVITFSFSDYLDYHREPTPILAVAEVKQTQTDLSTFEPFLR